MANPIAPIVDTDLENIKSQLEYAKALRGQSLDTKGENVSGIYVPKSPWLNFAQGLTGGGVESYQRGQQRGIEQQQQTERNNWLGQMPSATETVPQAGPTEDGGFLPDVERNKSPRALAKAMREWSINAPRGMEGVQNFAIQQALTAPEKEADRAFAAEAAKEQALVKAAEARETQRERQEWQDSQNELYRRTAAQQQAQLTAALAARGAGDNKPKMQFVDTVDENGNPIKQAVDMNAVKPGDTFGKPAKPPTKEEVAQGKLNEAPGRIDQIIKEAGENEKAFGIVPAASNLLPDFVGSRLRDKVLTEDQQKTRMKVQTQAAKVIHDVYGAALSRGEAFRANSWAPNPMDSYETTMTKLKAAKEYAAMMASKDSSPKKPAGGMSDDDLLKKYGGGK